MFYSWSRNGCKLLSASTDNNVCIWDVLSGECEQRYRFPSPVLKVRFTCNYVLDSSISKISKCAHKNN